MSNNRPPFRNYRGYIDYGFPNQRKASDNFYHPRTEASLRQEMDRTLDGHFPEIAKGQHHIFRKLRLDASGNTIPCPCTDRVTLEPDKDTYCPICMGEGYIWDEGWLTAYKRVLKSDVGNAQRENMIQVGLINIPIVEFFTRDSLVMTRDVSDLTILDKVVELQRDLEGNPIRPYMRTAIYRIDAAIDFRADNGRLEYWKLTCHYEQRKFLNGPEG